MMSPDIFVLSMFVAALIGLFLGHPVAFVLGGVAIIWGYLGMGPLWWTLFMGRTYDTMTNHLLIAIPLFVLMATLLERSGIADGLFRALMHLFGGMRGSVALATVVLATVFAATTGIVGATVVSMSLMAMPTMLRRGYDKHLASGTVAAGGTLGIIIPPSIMLVLMADQSGVSVGRLFAGAMGPGLLLATLYFLYIAIRTHLNPDMGPPLTPEERASVSTAELIRMLLVNLIPPLALILGVLGSIWWGVATPTEAAGIGVAIALLLMIVHGSFTWKGFSEALWSATRTSCMVIAVIIGASLFTAVFLGGGGGPIVTDLILSVDFLGKWGLFALMMLIVFLLGFILDWIGIVLITFPIFLPLARTLGFDETWFIVMVAVNLQAAFLTPPVGYALFYLNATVPKEVTLVDIYRGVVPFVALQLAGLVLAAVFPGLITWLPSLIGR